VFGTRVRGLEPGRILRTSQSKKSLRAHCFGGEEKLSVNVADLRNVKDPYKGVEVTIIGKITGHLMPTDPFSLLDISHAVCGHESTWR
jgi:hypothetical protein